MSETNTYDLIIIGAGPGGYVAAIRASRLGMKVALVDKRSASGGVCLNEGCIPSKALLDSSELFAVARDRFSHHGIKIEPPSLDLDTMMLRKESLVKKLTDGIDYLIKKNEVVRLHGRAILKGVNQEGQHQVDVIPAFLNSATNEQQSLPETDRPAAINIKAAKVILATGSESSPLPGIPFDSQVIVSAREALSFNTVPEHLIVAGGGAIGLELGSVWRRLGAQGTIMEMLPQILPNMDRQVSDLLYRSLRKQGMQFKLGTRITGVRRIGSKAIVLFNSGTGSEEIDCDKVLVAIGRRPNTSGIGLEELGIVLDESGRVIVDDAYKTTVAGIYAIGDLISGPMLAHKASEEGVACVEGIAGLTAKVEYEYIPGAVYTLPEASYVGLTEEQLKTSGTPYRSGRFNFAALGRARCMDETEGFVKILAHQENDRILGIHIVGPRASDLIAEAAAVMSFGGTSRDIALICHAHPTLPEAIREAALDVHKEAIHV
ncbi:MAG: dihydrolipoyl dehydrogenase [Desulfuromonadaceae bacterium]|nr:dihydrolipoyl dehydrogenase [Desulfuromonadaceae bacterium]